MPPTSLVAHYERQIPSARGKESEISIQLCHGPQHKAHPGEICLQVYAIGLLSHWVKAEGLNTTIVEEKRETSSNPPTVRHFQDYQNVPEYQTQSKTNLGQDATGSRQIPPPTLVITAGLCLPVLYPATEGKPGLRSSNPPHTSSASSIPYNFWPSNQWQRMAQRKLSKQKRSDVITEKCKRKEKKRKEKKRKEKKRKRKEKKRKRERERESE
ncbi:PREDICTED: transcription initiation factor TFIID subunit 3-like, partial [Galeopterus variegatus]|uniref:Transcription initiation factor TFIID subunit 3-like n=1 Tax=Galeopterus variegatus TaxID=482537 RepID=A0ABM0S6S7_GALVR